MGKCDTCEKKKYGYLCEGCIHDPDAMDKYEPMTNADRIRAMSDEELAELLIQYDSELGCYYSNIGRHYDYESAKEVEIEWLKQPVQEGE